MKRAFLTFTTFVVTAVLAYAGVRMAIRVGSPLVGSFLDRVPFLADAVRAVAAKKSPGRPGGAAEVSADSRTWTFSDGSRMEAALVSADGKNAQFRVLESDGLGQIELAMLSQPDQDRIRSLIREHGKNGVLGLPIPLKTHSWPNEWRKSGEVALTPVEGTNRWRSPHFDITNAAGIPREALESITMICEAVDGALSSLPLPVPVNWGREPGELRKIVIEGKAAAEKDPNRAGYWDGRTGMVHIYADRLLEPDLQLVVFEFDKPEKVQKYDVIVHEVTHQSTAGLIYMGVPAWVPEGLAEYMAATQFAPGFYDFENTHTPVRHHINKALLADRIVKERKMRVVHLAKFMNRDILEWNRVVESGDLAAGELQYNQALLLIDYFFHRDHPDGAHFRRYLESVLTGIPEPAAREMHLLRGRTYAQIEEEITKLWKPLGFALVHQDRGEIRREDIAIDWGAEDVRRSIATQRAMADTRDEE
jgi:hypothetical protein